MTVFLLDCVLLKSQLPQTISYYKIIAVWNIAEPETQNNVFCLWKIILKIINLSWIKYIIRLPVFRPI